MYRGRRIKAKLGLGIERSVLQSASYGAVDLNQCFDIGGDFSACCSVLLRSCVLTRFRSSSVFAGRPVCAFAGGKPGWFVGGHFSFLRPRHTHALPCWEGGT